ncbi:hypothetical protein N7492_006299 [Penicillium capsulatum]|uniref:N-acetylgalactosaminide beta-1,3-galactosyltransferase n=1 Tax=Penicillium capsulatum TaxID=69766 RepID=A0A9W9I3M1_9EURO|nr:hypothetical protein N7492_006299 [Penicillium capsulatum]KAJ6108949.1 hypothetical protein N7512_008786 [Penicillium capsulatum]
MVTLPARYGRWMPILAPMALLVLIIHLNSSFGTDSAEFTAETEFNTKHAQGGKFVPIPPAPCPSLPGIDDVLVVVKTGITEAREKVPVHVRTTLRCIPHKLVVSDFEEEIDGLRTHDVFRNASEKLRAHQDFALYNRAREGGRAALLDQDNKKVANGPSGMMDNPGWKLDKWKFLPMMQEARQYRPEARWYVFIEADTYAFWPNLLAWLEHFDSSKNLYLGNQMQIGENLFAHGGSGFVLSHGAMHAVADYHAKHVEEWEERTNIEWAGDCVLGIALRKIGIELTWSWPHVTRESIWQQDALGDGFGVKQWCHPAVTFHHMTPSDVERLWEFDERWFGKVSSLAPRAGLVLQDHANSSSQQNNTLLTYSDIFRNFVRPKLTERAEDWDNGSEDLVQKAEPMTIYECAEHCAKKPLCRQYSLSPDGRCKTSEWAMRGLASPGTQSGTMLWRVDAAVESSGLCPEPIWVTQ